MSVVVLNLHTDRPSTSLVVLGGINVVVPLLPPPPLSTVRRSLIRAMIVLCGHGVPGNWPDDAWNGITSSKERTMRGQPMSFSLDDHLRSNINHIILHLNMQLRRHNNREGRERHRWGSLTLFSPLRGMKWLKVNLLPLGDDLFLFYALPGSLIGRRDFEELIRGKLTGLSS